MSKKNKKSKKKIIALIVVIVVIVLLVIRAKIAGNTFPSVETTLVEKGTVSQELSSNGTITAVNSSTYASPVNAKVAKVNVKVGDTVAAGDTLVEYDTVSLEESYSLADLQAKAAIATSNDSVNKSNQSQTDKSNAENSITSLQSQIDAKNGEITSMQNDIKNNTIYQNDLNATISNLTAEIQSLSATGTSGTPVTLTEAQQAQLTKDQADLENYKSQLTAAANNRVAQQSALSSLQTQLADLTGQKTTAEANKTQAEAQILSEDQKASLSYNNQVSKLNVTTAGDELSKAQAGIDADNAGIVTEVTITDGAAATTGMALVTVADTSDMEVEFQVSKYDMERLEIGKEVAITALGNSYKGTVDKISRVATTGTSGSKMVGASVHIDNPDESLVIGLDAKLVIALGTAKDVLVIPLTAVNTDKDGSFVYAVEDGMVVKKPVTTGLSSNSEIEITDGLEEGDEVISLVDASIVEGMMVTTSTAGVQSTENAAQGVDSTEAASQDVTEAE